MAQKRVVKLSANLPEEVFDALRELAERRGVTVTETLRRAISTEKFVDDALREGDRILIKRKDEDSIRELVFRP